MTYYHRGLLYTLLFFPILLAAQGEYTPIQLQGNIPSQIYENYSKTIDREVKDETFLSKNEARQFYTGVTYNIWNILNSGKVYFDGPFTEHLQKVAAKLLANNPELLAKLKIYAYKSAALNAITYPDGHIFVNTGLIAATATEDQLAAILAHEIVHFAKEHSKQAFKKEQSLATTGYGSGAMASLYRILKYSKENEQEADAAGLQLLIASPYDASQMPTALRLLVQPDTLAFMPDFIKYFNNDIFTVDSAWVSAATDSAWKKKVKEDDEDETADDDVFSTHPDMEKRILALKEILQASDYKPASNSDNGAFQNLRQLALYETINNLYTFEYYTLSLYQSLKLLDKKPSDVFLQVNVIKCLYMLGYLRQVNKLENTLMKYGYTSEAGLNRQHAFLNQLSSNELKKLAYGYMKAHTDQLQDVEEFSFYQALLTDTYLGKEAATSYYNQYAAKYPAGKYITFVKNKLKSLL